MENFIYSLRIIRECALMFLLGTTALFTYSYSSDWMAQQNLHVFVSTFLAMIATGILTFVVDVSFNILLNLMARLLLGEEVKGIKSKFLTPMKVIITLGAIIMGGVTGSLTWLGSDEIAVASYERQDTNHLTETQRHNSSTLSANIERVKQELDDARSSLPQREAAARHKGKNLVRTAIKSGSQRWQQDWATSRGWFLSLKGSKYAGRIAYRDKILAAEQQAAALLAAERKKVEPLEAAFLQLSTRGTAAIDSTNATLSAAALGITAFDERRINARAKGVIIGDVVALLVAILLTFIIQMCDVEEKQPKYNAAKVVSENTFVAVQFLLSLISFRDSWKNKYVAVGAAAGARGGTKAGKPHYPTGPAPGPGAHHPTTPPPAPVKPDPTAPPHSAPVGSPHRVPHSSHSPTGPVVGSAPTASPHSPTARPASAIPTAPTASRKAIPTAPAPAPVADQKEIERVDKRCRRRYGLFQTYSQQAQTETDEKIRRRKEAQADDNYTGYLEDKMWLEFNGMEVFVKDNGKIGVRVAR